MIGGEVKVVEIDESKFGKRKYHRGHYVKVQLVFGGVERGTGRTFLVAVHDRSAETLIDIIKQWILPVPLLTATTGQPTTPSVRKGTRISR
jgi:hypothetical protein